jgi:hypothetical protein
MATKCSVSVVNRVKWVVHERGRDQSSSASNTSAAPSSLMKSKRKDGLSVSRTSLTAVI